MAASSGYGIGKSTLVASLVLWMMSTRPHARGTITANTLKQFEARLRPRLLLVFPTGA